METLFNPEANVGGELVERLVLGNYEVLDRNITGLKILHQRFQIHKKLRHLCTLICFLHFPDILIAGARVV